MPDKKKKKTVKESEIFEPKIVEVYGDDDLNADEELQSVSLGSRNKFNNMEASMGDSEKLSQEENEEMKEDHSITDSVQNEGGRETLKTEIVGENIGKKADVNVKVEGEQIESRVKDDATLRQAQDDSAFEDEIGHQRKAVRSVFGVGLVLFLLIFGLTGWAFYLKTIWLPKESVSQVLVTEASPSPSPDVASTPVVMPLTRDKIVLEVLNGSGVVGLAGKAAQTFEDLGYTSVDTGNAESVQTTEVYVQKDLESQLTVLMKDLEDALKVSSIAGYLKESDTVTARVILAQ